MRRARPSRVRRVLKWTGLVLCVLILSVWGLTGKWSIQLNSSSRWIGANSGVIQYTSFHGLTQDTPPTWPGGSAPLGWSFTAMSPWMGLDRHHSLSYLCHMCGFMAPKVLHQPVAQMFPRLVVPQGAGTVTATYILLPLWLPFVVVTIPTTWVFWRDRRRIPPGHCQKCGYNLTGNESGICSECGSVWNTQNTVTVKQGNCDDRE